MNDVLKIEAMFRESDFNLRQRRGEIWSEISERQSSIKPSTTKEGFVNQQHLLLAVPRPSWFDDGTKMSKKDATNLPRDVSNARKEIWKVTREPGTENPPKSFSLLPHFSLTRAFVKYDDCSIGTLAKFLLITGKGPNLKTEGVANAG